MRRDPPSSPVPRNYDRIWIRDGSAQALALLWAGLVEEAEAFVLWYSQRIYPNGMVPPILDEDGAINRGYGSDIEFDAQGEFVCVAAEAYRITRNRALLTAVLEPVVRATRFIEELCARTNAQHGPTSRFHGLLPPSLSHEGYGEPSYSYWDDFFALSAFRGCAFLADAAGEREIAAQARAKAKEFAEDLARSLRMTSELMGKGMIAGSADREDVDPTSTSIAFEPCRVEDVLPIELLAATYDLCAAQIKSLGAPDFTGSFTPYVVRNLNAFVSLGRFEDAFGLLELLLACRRPDNWRHWAEVVWSPPRAPQYIGDMPHTWIGAEFVTAIRECCCAKMATPWSCSAAPGPLVGRRGDHSAGSADGLRRRRSAGSTDEIQGDDRAGLGRSRAEKNYLPLSRRKARSRRRIAMRN